MPFNFSHLEALAQQEGTIYLYDSYDGLLAIAETEDIENSILMTHGIKYTGIFSCLWLPFLMICLVLQDNLSPDDLLLRLFGWVVVLSFASFLACGMLVLIDSFSTITYFGLQDKKKGK